MYKKIFTIYERNTILLFSYIYARCEFDNIYTKRAQPDANEEGNGSTIELKVIH